MISLGFATGPFWSTLATRWSCAAQSISIAIPMRRCRGIAFIWFRMPGSSEFVSSLCRILSARCRIGDARRVRPDSLEMFRSCRMGRRTWLPDIPPCPSGQRFPSGPPSRKHRSRASEDSLEGLNRSDFLFLRNHRAPPVASKTISCTRTPRFIQSFHPFGAAIVPAIGSPSLERTGDS
jgi:hypothetical protein